MTGSSWSQSTIPMEKSDGQWGSKLVKSHRCPCNQLLHCPRHPRWPHWVLLQWVGAGGLGEAGFCVCGFVLLPAAAAVTPPSLGPAPPRPHHSGRNASASPVLKAADSVLCNSILTATASSGVCCWL